MGLSTGAQRIAPASPAARLGSPRGVWEHVLQALADLAHMLVTLKPQLHDHEDIKLLIASIALLLRCAAGLPQLRDWLVVRIRAL